MLKARSHLMVFGENSGAISGDLSVGLGGYLGRSDRERVKARHQGATEPSEEKPDLCNTVFWGDSLEKCQGMDSRVLLGNTGKCEPGSSWQIPTHLIQLLRLLHS